MRYVFWDFDGTLSYYEHGYFTGTALCVLDELLPGHGITREALSPLINVCPWHIWTAPHTRMNGRPDLWWEYIERLFYEAIWECGTPREIAREAARRSHALYADLSLHYLFPDALPAVKKMAEAGYTQCILSNHMPELEELLSRLPISPYISHCVNSAHIGYEKPHPAFFEYALKLTGAKPSECWMVGDNIEADVMGGEAAGLNCILVRKPPKGRDVRYAPDLLAAAELILRD